MNDYENDLNQDVNQNQGLNQSQDTNQNPSGNSYQTYDSNQNTNQNYDPNQNTNQNYDPNQNANQNYDPNQMNQNANPYSNQNMGSQNGYGYSQNQYDQYGQPILPNQYDAYGSQNQSFSGHPNYSYTQPKKQKKPKKPVTWGAVIAVILVCAIVFGSLGYGIAWSAASRSASSSSQTESSTSSTSGSAENSTPTSEELNLKVASTEGDALTIPEIAAKAEDSVVEITTEAVTTGEFMQQYISSGAGSGVIITEDGYIVTNNHVIEDANSITVTLHSGESYDATVVGADSQTDTALLKIDATGLTPATIGTSSDLVVGQTVVVIGNPLGQLGGSVTSGIISALDRSITIDSTTMTLLQIDAAVNPGNSGGGLFDAQGNLIGIVNAKSSGTSVEGIGFAIPIDNVVSVLDDLKTYGYVRGRVAIGVTLLDVSSQQSAWMYQVSETGVYVYSVTDGSPAQEGGLQSGDRIVSINGTEVSTASEVKAILQECSVGDTLTFVVSRNGTQVTLTVIAGEYTPSSDSNSSSSSTSDSLVSA